MSNVAAILLAVDTEVDRQQFRNHMKIQDSLSAVSHVSEYRSGTGRHGGRPSQMPEATRIVASGFIPRFVALSPGVKPVATNA